MPSLFGRHDSAIVKCSWFRSRSDGRFAMVRRSPQLWVRACGVHMLNLSGYRRDMSLTCGSLFLRPRTLVDASFAAVVTHPRSCVVVHSGLVDVVNLPDVHIVHRTVVEE